jgi:hypothetical protein
METTNNKPIGPTMGLIIILLIIIAGGIYFWLSRSNTKIIENSPNNNTETINGKIDVHIGTTTNNI